MGFWEKRVEEARGRSCSKLPVQHNPSKVLQGRMASETLEGRMQAGELDGSIERNSIGKAMEPRESMEFEGENFDGFA